MRTRSLAIAVVAAFAASVATLVATGPVAQQPGQAGGPMSHGAMQQGAMATRPAVEAYKAANARMHAAMDIAYTGNPDRDFALSMIPHHQGAIDMAEAELAHGTDPELRKLAQEVIQAQKGEIALLRAWLARTP